MHLHKRGSAVAKTMQAGHHTNDWHEKSDEKSDEKTVAWSKEALKWHRKLSVKRDSSYINKYNQSTRFRFTLSGWLFQIVHEKYQN